MSTHYFEGDVSSAEAATDSVNLFWNNLRTIISNSVAMVVNPEVEQVDPATGFVTDIGAGNPYAFSGGSSAESLPLQTQGLLPLRSSVFLEGRRIQGRLYIWGVTEQGVDLGRPNGNYVGPLIDAADNLRESLDVSWGIWSRKNGLFAPITSTGVANIFGVQRSRRD